MIFDVILEILFTPIEILLDVLPSFTWPEIVTGGIASGSGGADPTMQELAWSMGRWLSYLEHWVPIDLLFQFTTVVAACGAFYISAKAARLVVSVFTGGGGAT